jgi:hypothetical protein
MRKKIILVGVATIALLFSGCGRNYFEPAPQTLKKPIYFSKSEINSTIEYFNRDVATLKDGTILPYKKQLPKGFVAIDNELAKNGSILRVGEENIEFDRLIATAKRKGDLIAVLFADDSFQLYDLKKREAILKETFAPSLANRKFITQPYFYKDLLLIPTLSGVLKIVDLKKGSVIQSIVVTEKDYFNNIIFLDVKNENLIVATRDKIMVIAPMFHSDRSFDIKHIVTDDNYIYLFTNEGTIKKLNFLLKEIKSVDFKYANILSPTISNGKIYFLSRGGGSYLVSMNKEFENVEIFPLIELKKDSEDRCFREAPLYLKKEIFFDKTGNRYIIGDYSLKLK